MHEVTKMHALTLGELKQFCYPMVVDMPVIMVGGKARALMNLMWDSIEDVEAELRGKEVYTILMADVPGRHKYWTRCWYEGMEEAHPLKR